MEQRSILIVDDELLIRDLLYDFFNSQGWQISIADSGTRALEILKSKKVDLLLTDLRMPQMDGLTLISHVKQDYPEIPVMIMTAFPSVESAIAALRSRVVDYITKPFNIHELYKRVNTYVPEP